MWFLRKSKKKEEVVNEEVVASEETVVEEETKEEELQKDEDGNVIVTKEHILKILHPIKDPDLHVSIVDLGLIREVHIDRTHVTVEMILTSPGCPYGPLLLTMVQRMLELEDYLDDPQVELIPDQYVQLSDLSDEQRLALGLDF